LKIFEAKEYNEIMNSVLTIEDFAVRITHLPSIGNFGSQLEMKAYLCTFFENIIEKEP
jgi:hypothetical protein